MYSLFYKKCAEFWTDQTGATAIEYALIMVMVSLAGIVAMTATGNVVSEPFQKASEGFNK